MSYQEHGYEIILNILSKADCEALISLAADKADRDFAPIINLEKICPVLNEAVLYDPLIFNSVNQLIGDCRPVGTMFHFKKPGTPYALQAWNPHQDNSYVLAKHGTFISAILALVDADKENGGMYCYPGSHVETILPFNPNPSYDTHRPGNEIGEVYFKKYRKKNLRMKQGSLYIQHGNLVHGSYSNRSKRSREMLGIMYLAKSEKYKPGKRRSG